MSIIICQCSNKLHFENVSQIRCGMCKQTITFDGIVQLTPPTQPLSYDEWPAWAKAISLYRKPEDIGVGDTAQRIAARLGGEEFKWLSLKLGIPCGCTERQIEWNEKYPYANRNLI